MTALDSMGMGMAMPAVQTVLPAINHRLSTANIDKASQDFEAMFLSQMFQEMFTGLGEDSLTGDPESDEIYRSMAIDQYGRIVAQSGGIGIADYVKRELLKHQEVTS